MLNPHILSFTGKIIASEASHAITSATGTQPEKNELHQQKVMAMMTI